MKSSEHSIASIESWTALAMDQDAVQLASLGQSYYKVEKETQKLAEELENSQRMKRRLEAEVNFLQQKLKLFKRARDHTDVRRIEGFPLNLEKPLPAVNQQRRAYKPVEPPQFYEVEVKYAHFDSMENGVMEPNVLDYPRRDFVSHLYPGGQGSVYWQGEKTPVL